MTAHRWVASTPVLEAGLVICWSSGFIGGTLAVATPSIFLVLFWRFVLATLCLVPLSMPQIRRLSMAQIGTQALIGSLAMFGYLATVISARPGSSARYSCPDYLPAAPCYSCDRRADSGAVCFQSSMARPGRWVLRGGGGSYRVPASGATLGQRVGAAQYGLPGCCHTHGQVAIGSPRAPACNYHSVCCVGSIIFALGPSARVADPRARAGIPIRRRMAGDFVHIWGLWSVLGMLDPHLCHARIEPALYNSLHHYHLGFCHVWGPHDPGLGGWAIDRLVWSLSSQPAVIWLVSGLGLFNPLQPSSGVRCSCYSGGG